MIQADFIGRSIKDINVSDSKLKSGNFGTIKLDDLIIAMDIDDIEYLRDQLNEVFPVKQELKEAL